jgi:predicted acylesterase/phospholipase RssA
MKIEQYATFIRMNVATMNYTRIGTAIGCSADAVRSWCFANGCERPPAWVQFTDEEKQYIRDNWRSMSDDALCANLGRGSKTTVANYRQREGLHRANPNKGFQAWRQGQAKRAMEAPEPKDIIDLAAEHVARHDRVPVFRIDGTGNPHKRGEAWRYGTTRLTTDQLMAKATRKGFDASIYQVAA